MPRSKRCFLAPVHYEPGDIGESGEFQGRNYRAPGLSSMMPLRRFPTGLRCLYPEGVQIEWASAETPASWERRVFAVVPREEADRERVYAWLTRQGGPESCAPDEAFMVVSPEEAPEHWERVEVAEIPLSFWERFGDAYAGPYGELLPEDYRVTVEFHPSQGSDCPGVWEEYKPRVGAPYPLLPSEVLLRRVRSPWGPVGPEGEEVAEGVREGPGEASEETPEGSPEQAGEFGLLGEVE